MRLPSSTAEPLPSVFGAILARGPVAGLVNDHAWLQAMLDVEAALARASATVGVVPVEAAEQIAARCHAELFDLGSIGAESAAAGNPVVPLVRALTAEVPTESARYVHFGATSQDVLDTAAMLLCRQAAAAIVDDLAAAADTAAHLSRTHRDTVMAGRTLLQQALPTTFGLKTSGWLVGLDGARGQLVTATQSLAVQLGGAVGTLASLGDAGPAVMTAFAAELGLAEPLLPWHTDRTRPAAFAAALGVVAGSVAKVGGDIVLLAQTEVAELIEAGPAGSGRSSTLPHKRNPVAAVAARACAAAAPGLVATLFTAMAQEHERAAGAWQAEWRPLGDLLVSTGSAVSWLRESLGRLEVDAERMRRNLGATDGLIAAEQLVTMLTPVLGRLPAHDLVQQACSDAVSSGRPLREVLQRHDELADIDVDAALQPSSYLGAAGTFVDRAIAGHRATE
jgi:3-carboxy-cis,cis-muconate cycloisomerase